MTNILNYDTLDATDCTGGEFVTKVTIYTLAKELNMTPSMISRAFNPNGKISDEKRKIILEVANRYGFTPNKFASRLSMKNVRIGVLINSRFAINTDKMIAGIENAYAKLKDYKIQYDVTIMNSLENKSEDYIDVLNRYKNYNGLIVAGMSSEKYVNMLNTVCKENSNVVQVQAVNKSVDSLFVSKHNEETASSLAAEFLYNCLKGKERKNILLFTGDKESALHSESENAFKNACKEFDLCVLKSIDMKDSEEYFSEIISDVFERYISEADGIYITSGISSPLCRYIEENNINIPFVSFDTYEDIKKYIKKGIISATIAQNVEKQMENAFEYLVKHIISDEEFPKTVYTDVQLVLKSNMHQFS